ncbi:MAG: DUF3500 domain-containing protein [Planctomycetota bacterium]
MIENFCSRLFSLTQLGRMVAVVIVGSLITLDCQAHDVAKEMADAANTLLKSLDDEQQASIQFEFADELRKDWQFIPMERKGLGLKSMKPHQRGLAMSLVQSALSHRGFSTTMQIMSLEQVLRELEKNPVKRDPEKYHLFLFGEPSTDSNWGWRIEGHHLSISITVAMTEDGQQVMVHPSFFGSNPAEVRGGPMDGLRVLGDLEDKARELVKKLSVEQKKSAIIETKVPRDVINGPGTQAQLLSPGIAASKLDSSQQALLKELVDLYVGKFRAELMKHDLAKIDEAGFDKISFAWIGKIQKGQPHYFRVQGASFVLEYDNTQNKANHVHVVWRDLQNDFGQDTLERHYELQHSNE